MRLGVAFKWLGLVGVSLTLLGSCAGCSTLGYYLQGARGHLDLIARREPIDALLVREDLPKGRLAQLAQAAEIRRYGVERLGLPDNDSYKSFVELGRPYAVWSVVAAPEFSLQPKEWCFPIVGCVSYRGYFDEREAQAYGEGLRAEGYEVFVAGVQAYSTLGWFADPLLSSMVDRGGVLTAEVVFHELAHQVLYFPNDTDFNEAFATVVGEAGVRQWLRETAPEDLPKYVEWLGRKDDFIALLKTTSDELRALYAQRLPEVEMRTRKQAVLDGLREHYAALKQRWGGFAGYDRWFDQPVNNARLASVAVYRDLVPEFTRWLEACGGDFRRYYAAMAALKPLDKAERHARLKGPAACS